MKPSEAQSPLVFDCLSNCVMWDLVDTHPAARQSSVPAVNKKTIAPAVGSQRPPLSLAEIEAANREASPTRNYTIVAEGDVLLAIDLAAHDEQALGLAAQLAQQGRTATADDLAIVVVTNQDFASYREDPFFESNEPGLFAAEFPLEPAISACRRLLVLLDDCRRRFRRTVLMVESDNAKALDLIIPRVDETLVIGAANNTPTSEILLAEKRFRRHGLSASRLRVLLAA